MRSRGVLLTLSLYLVFAALGCTSKPSTDSSTDASNQNAANTDTSTDSKGAKKGGRESRERKEAKEAKEAKETSREPVVVPAGTAVTVSLGSALGSKLSQSGQTFSGSVAKDVLVGNAVAIRQGANVSGTVTDAKALGKFAGGAVLTLRLDSIDLNGANTPVQASVKTFSQKGKGKRTAVLAGGGAALGWLIGGLAGGGKGAAIGLAAGGGAGAGRAPFAANHDLGLPGQSRVSFELSHSLEVRQ